MSYIEFAFLPLKINKKFNKAKKEIDCEKKIKLFDKYEAKINLFRNFINKTLVYLIIDELDKIDEINNLLISYYGKPNFISNCKMSVWKINDIYISHGREITRLDEDIHCLSISLLPPLGIYDYNSYNIIKVSHEKLRTEFNFKKAKFLSLDVLSELHLWYQSLNYVYIIDISKKHINICIRANQADKKLLCKNVKYRYKSNSEIYNIIYSFFKDRIVYDTSLYK